jgi:hypothetical protein
MGQVGRIRRTEGVDKYEDKKKGGEKGKEETETEKGRINEFEENEEGEGKKGRNRTT